MRSNFLAAFAIAGACTLPGTGLAQTPSSEPAVVRELAIELNNLTPSETGCRMSLVATNRLGTRLDSAELEIAMFGATGGIDRMLALNLQAMPEGKTRVLQFDIGQLDCDSVSRVLINDVTVCSGVGLDPEICGAALDATSRLDVSLEL